MLDSLLEKDEFVAGTAGEGLDEPRHSNICLGFETQEKQVLDLYESGQMPHALIFSGPKGIGKSTFAYRVARFLLKNGLKDNDSDQGGLFGEALPSEPLASLDVSKNEPTFTQVAAGGHSDLLTIERQIDTKKGARKANLDVETARKVAPFLRMTASNGGWRLVVIDDADTMNRNAQNALLKILEEPPKNTLLILITHRLGAMIPTIRSRCRTINCQPLNNDHMKTLLGKVAGSTLSNDEESMILSMSSGQIRKAIDLYEQGGLEILTELLSVCGSWPQFPWVTIHQMADNVGRAGQDSAYKAFEQSFLWLAETITLAKAKNIISLDKPLNSGVFASMMAHYSLEQWLNICENLKQHFDQARVSNLDKRQAVLRAFAHLSA